MKPIDPQVQSALCPLKPLPVSSRLAGLDALRCVAAFMVMLFHYTTRYGQKFGHLQKPMINVAWGYVGVNLFFMVSGFVIFMTLERTRHPRDFLVSRFSRLYPSYWVAAIITYATIALAPELGKSIRASEALGNVLMFQELLGIHSIDGVYWTLEVELLFYCGMLLIWLTESLTSLWLWMGSWLVLCIAEGLFKSVGFGFPYVVSRVLILPYFPYFALGCILYLSMVRKRFRWPVEGALRALALLAIAVGDDSVVHLGWTLLFLASFQLVLPRHATNPLVHALGRLGIVSYPFYLLHETIGWTAIHRLEAHGVNTDLAIVAALVIALILAYVLHAMVEQPAMLAIRRRNAARQHDSQGLSSTSRTKWIAGTVLIAIAVLIGNRLSLIL